ncbi:putative protein [Arabidopsis thaliana]|uniref:Uncharacterized protein T28A8_60 n=1 Tax=Arabidopsis thaliana TaxID=3702 RepID=Q9LZH0_ARATH|nr:putative protein [Arabidopsis thaliana]
MAQNQSLMKRIDIETPSQTYVTIGECVKNGQVEVDHIPGNEKKVDILTKALGRMKVKEMRDLISVQDVVKYGFKLKGENVGVSLKLI